MNEPLVVAVSSRALFDLEKENAIFESEGIAAYRAYQTEHKNIPLKPGVAFGLVQRLLRLNQLFQGQNPFRIVVISRNSPETAQRFFNSCRHYKLPIKAGIFTSGHSTFPYLKSFNTSLFLSANKENVMQAVQAGLPAGWVLPTSQEAQASIDDDEELRIAFDFDGVIVDDESEKKYQEEGMVGFEKHEVQNKMKPHAPGPLHMLFKKLAEFQQMDAKRGKSDPQYNPAIRVSIVTARGAPSEERLITTLQSLGMSAAELFLLDGSPKKDILKVLRPHIFFDDQIRHLEGTSQIVPSVLIPFGVNNDV